MTSKAERLEILDMIQNGVISAEEGARLLQALGNAGEPDAVPQIETTASARFSSPEKDPPMEENTGQEDDQSAADQAEVLTGDTLGNRQVPFNVEKWQRWWLYFMWAGIAVTVLGGILMYQALQASGIGFWFACAWAPFLLGIAVMLLAFSSRTAKWLHLRVQQPPGEWPSTIAISLPLPLGLAAWFVRTFGRYIPQLDQAGLDQVLLALGENTSPQAPFYIEVEEGDDGERVEIYIG